MTKNAEITMFSIHGPESYQYKVLVRGIGTFLCRYNRLRQQ